jgi:hypothetical protein
MRIIAGPPVSGADFKFRATEIALATQSLADGTSLLVKGWRRIGKSSLLVETARVLGETPATTPIYLDVQDMKSLSEFFSGFLRMLPADRVQWLRKQWDAARLVPGRILDAMQRRIRKVSAGGGGFEGGLELDASVREYWEPLNESVERLAREQLAQGNRIILLIDELPFFLENMHRQTKNVDDIRIVLATLRAWRNAGLTMAIAGSVSIQLFLEDLEIEGLVINDLQHVDLQPLALAEAEALVGQLAEIAKLTDWNATSTAALLAELPDHFPFFIQTAMNLLRASGSATPEQIADVAENRIQPQIFATFYQQFDERLARRFEPGIRAAAEGVLNAMAKDEGGRITNAEIDRICEATGQDPLSVKRRLELAEFVRGDPRKGGYRLVQNLLKTWRAARGGV